MKRRRTASRRRRGGAGGVQDGQFAGAAGATRSRSGGANAQLSVAAGVIVPRLARWYEQLDHRPVDLPDPRRVGEVREDTATRRGTS
jgi:hypothetical protein